MHPIIAEALVRDYQSSRIKYAQQMRRDRMARSAARVDRKPRRRLRWERPAIRADGRTTTLQA
jgi:hypothetical protein